MAVLSDADLLLHPSSYETFGVVLAEAMALGVPAIATRCGGPQFIISKETGRLVPVDDVGSLVQAVHEIAATLPLWRARWNAISSHARSKYHEKNITKELIEIYNN
jgi:glycosyltransferase involved in cell wall biosynthesis